jgi:hypothetical protein
VGTLVWPNDADFDPATLHDWPDVRGELAARARTWDHSADDQRANTYQPSGRQGQRRSPIRLSTFIAVALSSGMVHAQDETPGFLLIAREWLRPGIEDAYNENEVRLASACATLRCPHPYLALRSVAKPTEVWWLNAFVSAQERDGLDDAYAQNEPLMAVLAPLGKRKEDFRETLTTTRATHRPDVSGRSGLSIAGARFLIVSTTKDPESGGSAAVFQSSDGESLKIAAAPTRAAAEEIAAQFGSGAMILAVQPQWSFPAETWVQSDPDFWSSRPAARDRRQ